MHTDCCPAQQLQQLQQAPNKTTRPPAGLCFVRSYLPTYPSGTQHLASSVASHARRHPTPPRCNHPAHAQNRGSWTARRRRAEPPREMSAAGSCIGTGCAPGRGGTRDARSRCGLGSGRPGPRGRGRRGKGVYGLDAPCNFSSLGEARKYEYEVRARVHARCGTSGGAGGGGSSPAGAGSGRRRRRPHVVYPAHGSDSASRAGCSRREHGHAGEWCPDPVVVVSSGQRSRRSCHGADTLLCLARLCRPCMTPPPPPTPFLPMPSIWGLGKSVCLKTSLLRDSP